MSTVTEAAPRLVRLDDPTALDRALVGKARRGDRGSFETLVRRHTVRLYRIVHRIVGSREDAEDCVQNAWLAAWRGLPDYRDDAAPTTWLYRIATNEALMLLRHRRGTVPFDEVQRLPAAEGRDTADRVVADLAVRRALQQLEPHHRTVVVLREFEALSYDQIADVLGISHAAVRNRLHRARTELVTLLEEWR